MHPLCHQESTSHLIGQLEVRRRGGSSYPWDLGVLVRLPERKEPEPQHVREGSFSATFPVSDKV